MSLVKLISRYIAAAGLLATIGLGTKGFVETQYAQKHYSEEVGECMAFENDGEWLEFWMALAVEGKISQESIMPTMEAYVAKGAELGDRCQNPEVQQNMEICRIRYDKAKRMFDYTCISSIFMLAAYMVGERSNRRKRT